jgi:hypothetical protein
MVILPDAIGPSSITVEGQIRVARPRPRLAARLIERASRMIGAEPGEYGLFVPSPNKSSCDQNVAKRFPDPVRDATVPLAANPLPGEC